VGLPPAPSHRVGDKSPHCYGIITLIDIVFGEQVAQACENALIATVELKKHPSD
jgi:hypothetical protein